MSEFIVPAIAPRIRHLASGPEEARRVFSFPFPAASAGDIAVHRDGTLLEGGYATVFAEDRQGGSVTFDAAVPEGAEIVILRSTVIERATDFVENGAFRASALNLELDRLTMIAQELDLAGRAGLHRDPSEVGPDLVLPAPSSRANGLLGFSADGQALAVLPVESLRGERGVTGPQGPAGDMSGANNLSELTDPAVARANLDASSRMDLEEGLATVDAAIRQVDLNLALNTLRDAIDAGWTTLAMVDGFADEFNDQSGVAVDPAENAPLWGTTNGQGSISGATLTAAASRWSAATSEVELSSGKRYAEIEHTTIVAEVANYHSHGLTSVSPPDTNTNVVTGTHTLMHHGHFTNNGASQVDKRDTAFTSQFGSYVAAGTKGCIAVDFDAGKAWLGFVTQWGCSWWVDGGRPEDGYNPSFTFTPNTPMRLIGWSFGQILTINTGRTAFANQMVPRGFIPGWFETDGEVDGPYGPNIAPTGTASSPQGQSGIRTYASGIDQDLNSFWQAASSSTNCTYVVQFPEAKTVKRGVLRRHAGGTTYLTGINLEGSNDGTNWTVLAQYIGGPRIEGDYIFDVASPQPFTHYQLRAIYSSANGLAVGEFQLYEEVPVVNTLGGLSSGQTYDVVGDYYSSNGLYSRGTPVGDLTTEGGLSALFDGSTSVGAMASTSANVKIGLDFGASSSSPAISRIEFQCQAGLKIDSGVGAQTITTCDLYGSADGSFGTDTLLESFEPLLNDQDAQNFVLDVVADTTGYRMLYLLLSHDGGAETQLVEVRFFQRMPMTLVSVAALASEEPIAARAVLLVEPLEDTTLNTDLTCEVSRDDGESWTALVLSREVAFESGLELLAGAEASLEMQSSGMAMRIRLRTPTSRRIRVKGWAMQWR